MADWTHLTLTADARKTLEAELAASQGDYRKTMQAIDDYVDDLVSDLFDPDDPEHSLAYTDPDAIADAARDIVSLSQEAADGRYMVQRSAWQEAAGADFPAFAGADREDWTRVMWDVQHGFSNTDYNGLTYGQVMAGRARSGVTIMDLLPKAASNNPDDLQQAYADFLRQMAVHAAQRQQMADIATDPTHPRWARVPRGRVTCAFCTMLAGRGFAYTSEEAAGGGLGSKYHNHCDCEPVPSWGEAKLAGYDPEKLDALYREAARGLPDGASYREILSRMRAQGGVADSPATQAGSGGGNGKPPKPPKATAAAPEPDKPKKPNENEGGGIIDVAKSVEHRDMCRRTLEDGGLLSSRAYDRAVAAGETRGYDDWAEAMVEAEASWRDPRWLAGGDAHGIGYVSEKARADKWESDGSGPNEIHARELDTAELLKANGVRCTFTIDHEFVDENGEIKDKGLADLADGTELKTLRTCSTKNTVDYHMKNTSKKRDVVRVVFDNSLNPFMSDEELAGYLRRSRAFKNGATYMINSDGVLVRIR